MDKEVWYTHVAFLIQLGPIAFEPFGPQTVILFHRRGYRYRLVWKKLFFGFYINTKSLSRKASRQIIRDAERKALKNEGFISKF